MKPKKLNRLSLINFIKGIQGILLSHEANGMYYKSQINRFLKFINKHKNEIEYWKDTINGIHTITEFEKITTKLLN